MKLNNNDKNGLIASWFYFLSVQHWPQSRKDVKKDLKTLKDVCWPLPEEEEEGR